MTKAGQALKRWRRAKKLSQTAAAELVGVEQPTWSRWETGVWRPESPMRDVLQNLTAIDPGAWDSAAERAVKRKAKRAATAFNQRPAATA
jgi:transcriptional regulator with XRE-family HTH domain